MKKYLNYALDLNNLKKTVGFQNLWEAMKSELRLQVIDNPSSLMKPSSDHAKILVLSPHPDDDIFALGGTLSKFKKNGDKITILYFCDGSKGTPEKIRDSSLVMKRKKEAKESAEVIGIKNLIFWGFKDGQLQVTKTAIKGLYNLLQDFKPDIIFLPSIIDNHPDHLATNEIFYYTFFKYPEKPFDFLTQIAMYELWTPLFPNRIINITSEVNIKLEAIRCHRSQLKSRGYDEAVMALNKYRAELNKIKGHAEAIFISNPAIYKCLFERSK